VGWVILICACVAMYRIAEIEHRSGWLWAALTFGICFGCAMFIPLPFLNILIGFAISFGIMFAMKLAGYNNT